MALFCGQFGHSAVGDNFFLLVHHRRDHHVRNISREKVGFSQGNDVDRKRFSTLLFIHARRSDCGSFALRLSLSQLTKVASRMPKVQHLVKMSLIGGEGIRGVTG